MMNEKEIKSDKPKKMQVRSDEETEKEFDQLFNISGCKTKGELMKKIIQLGFMEHFKKRNMQEINVDIEDVVGTSILKLQHHLDGIAKIFVNQHESVSESLVAVHEKKQEEIAHLKNENSIVTRRLHEVEKESESLNTKIIALEEAARTNSEVIMSYKNYKKLTQPKVDELEQKLEQFEDIKKKEFTQMKQTIAQLEEALRVQKGKNIDQEHANKQLIIDYENKLLEERGRSSEAQDKIRREMQEQLDDLREKMWKSRIEKPTARATKQTKETVSKQP
ncbi:hypothetical protein BK126_14985 [Paenibacillus sp. FSL H7-0326]|uniref:hypothetical protein n=1 Tax=Paenibacillus sp. FSL H7-0326 TaxID=1921144 RepID=UPI00096D47A8|nr:hypothetical protein [Paenibacillus sp. FSL H7-0326]OMC69078.1 hypothetical protein BK126_14985 [Paenibacillus sp. FSL H7-0326]